MKFEESKWFDILFDNTKTVTQKIFARHDDHHEQLFVNGKLAAEMVITADGTKYTYYD